MSTVHLTAAYTLLVATVHLYFTLYTVHLYFLQHWNLLISVRDGHERQTSITEITSIS